MCKRTSRLIQDIIINFAKIKQLEKIIVRASIAIAFETSCQLCHPTTWLSVIQVSVLVFWGGRRPLVESCTVNNMSIIARYQMRSDGSGEKCIIAQAQYVGAGHADQLANRRLSIPREVDRDYHQ